jgi:hypothetical protein
LQVVVQVELDKVEVVVQEDIVLPYLEKVLVVEHPPNLQ